MNRQNKKQISLLLGFCLLITMGGFGNLKWANAADATMAVADAEPTEEPTDVKNASDVAAINKIIADQRAKGATVSENLDDTDQYTWKDGRLVEIKWISKWEYDTTDYNLTEDISFNDLTALETIDCRGNRNLTAIEVSGCTALKTLHIAWTGIRDLNLENNAALETLECYQCPITNLDVDKNEKLKTLTCFFTQISDLDVNHNPELENLECGETQIKHLDVSKLANLQKLSCDGLEIENLDLSSNKKLETLFVQFVEHISSIDLSNNVELKELQDKYSTYLMQITRRIIIDEEDAKECVNDVWLKVWNSIPPGKPTHLAGYLAKIARNLALDKYRQHNAAKRGGGHLEASLEELEECISGSNEIEEKINIEHLKTVIQQFLERSPKKKRIIFLQRYFYMLDTAEIAYMMQMKETSIRSILSRMRKELKSVLEEGGIWV